MKRGKRRHNFKRRIAQDVSEARRRRLADRVRYGGNPEHKRNPGDFGLTPPSQPRPDKTLCDIVTIFSRSEALPLLRAGVLRGLISEQSVDDLPQNIWGMTDDGHPLEAQLENRGLAIYHGYPLDASDPFRELVIEAWNSSTEHDPEGEPREDRGDGDD